VELGGSAGIQVSFTDPGILDTHTASIDWGDGTTTDAGSVTSPFDANHTYAAVGSYTVVVTVTDKDGDSGTGSTTIEVTQTPVPNTPPVLDAIGDQTVDEGSELSFTATASDADGDPLTFSLVDEPAGATIDATTGVFSWTPPDGPASATFTVVVSDGEDSDQETITVTVLNVAPDVTDVSGPASAVELGGSAGIQVSFTDPGILDTHTASIDWGDGTTTDAGSVTSPFDANHTYAAVGSYTVVVTVTDKDGDSGTGSTTIEVTQTFAPDPDPPLVDGDEWCSAGFWSNNGLVSGEWPAGYSPDDAVSTLFQSADGHLGSASLLDALEGYRGSPVRRNTIEGASEILLRQAVAAALNAEVLGDGFQGGTVQQIIDEVDEALESGHRQTILELADYLDALNNNYQLDEHGQVVLDDDGNPMVIGSCGLPRQ
jgi:PKD repeat protein